MDELYSKFQLKLLESSKELTFDEIKFDLWNPTDIINEIWNIIPREEDKNQIFTTFIIQFTLYLSKSIEIEDEYLKLVAMLFDLSYEFDLKSPDGFFFMQSFSSISNSFQLNHIKFNEFSNWFFNNENQFRVLNLTKNKKLLGKLRPGSKLLSLFNQINEKTQTFIPENNINLNNFRKLILNSIEINDKLSNSLNWSINNNQSKFKNISSINNIRGFGCTIPQLDYLLLGFLNFIGGISNKPYQVIINELNSKNFQMTVLNQFHNIIKALKLLKNKVNPISKSFQLEWVIEFKSFHRQLLSLNKFWTFSLQVFILINSFMKLSKNEFQPLIKIAMNDLKRKFKLPPQFINLLSNHLVISKLKLWIEDYCKHFENFHPNEINYILNENEKSWSLMKLKLFNHPQIKLLKSIDSSPSSNESKRKLENYIENHNEEKIIKKRKLIHLMGTPKLSKIWRVNNNLEKLKPSECIFDKLNSIKDELYFSKGKLSELENTQDVYKEEKETYDRLIWKECKLERFNFNCLNQQVEF